MDGLVASRKTAIHSQLDETGSEKGEVFWRIECFGEHGHVGGQVQHILEPGQQLGRRGVGWGDQGSRGSVVLG